MSAEMLPTSEVMTELAGYAGSGFVFGFGIVLAFWVGGYAVRSLLGYLRGGY